MLSPERFNALYRTELKSLLEKQRIQLKNIDHKVAERIYVTETLADWRI
jgi:hypothetical protein